MITFLLGAGEVPAAIAQEAAGGAPAGAGAPSVEPTPETHPPELIGFVEAPYPEAAQAAGQEGRVVLKLTVGADGLVAKAEVVEPVGYGFDEAAREAALRFRFAPARRGQTPVAARILYAYEFRRREPAVLAERSKVSAERPKKTAPRAPRLAGARAIEVTVKGATEAEQRRRSAEAVSVIETEEAQRQAGDLGEVLARTEGVGLRREGGLGSNSRLSLGGLDEGQIRVLLDGAPLDLSGYALGIANLPVNLIERIELYRGVVPLRFGTDALGGAVNLVTERGDGGTHASASYEVGSFNTHRLTWGSRYLHEPSGFFTQLNGFVDYARNDYPIEAEVHDDSGRTSSARVARWHDGYRAAGAGAEVGLVKRRWAEHLLLRAFYTRHDKEVQQGFSSRIPYGDVTTGKQSGGAQLRYAQPLSSTVRFDGVAGYSYVFTTFRDLGMRRYNWYGRIDANLPQPGEIEPGGSDEIDHEHTVFARLNLAWRPASGHFLRLGLAPTFATRNANDREKPAGNFDDLTDQRTLLIGVGGVEYEARPRELMGRLANIAFIKSYLQVVRAKQEINGFLHERDGDRSRLGVGDSVRYRFTDVFYAKASYEYATRLPTSAEMFGDGAALLENLKLKPEVSHNLNLELAVERAEIGFGQVRLRGTAFGRFARDLIQQSAQATYSTYENIDSVRIVGFEATAGWTSPGDWVSLDGRFTQQDLRNTTSEGPFGRFEGQRLKNTPYQFASSTVRGQWSELVQPGDVLSLTWHARYVKSFFNGWEGIGAPDTKLVIPSQLLHTLALTYLVEHGERSVSATFEIQNLTNERAYDYFKVELPGRAAYGKLVLDL